MEIACCVVTSAFHAYVFQGKTVKFFYWRFRHPILFPHSLIACWYMSVWSRLITRGLFCHQIMWVMCLSVIKGTSELWVSSAQRPETSMILILNYRKWPEPIAHLENSSVKTRTFPDTWKTAVISPVFTSGEPDLTCNYRPVVISPSVSKLLEKLQQSNSW